MHRLCKSLVGMFLLAVASPAAAQLDARIAELPRALRGEIPYDAYFADVFRAQVPREKFDALTAQISAANGAPTGIETVTPASPTSATLRVGYERGVATMQLSVEATAPYRVNGLFVSGLAARGESVPAVLDEIGRLPGITGFALARLDANGPVVLHARNESRATAVGSEFKLLVLAELVRAITARERGWDDRIGAATLRQLAGRMIAASDNRAADALIGALGRARIEAMLPVVGIARPAGMRPLLTTLELFKLKAGPLAARYTALDEAGRRVLLAGEVAAMPTSAIPRELFQDRKPRAIDTIEWFASPMDMVRVMDWLRRQSERGPGAELRAILSANAGIAPADKALWRFVGYKGGSEPGVIATTWLLQRNDGIWFAASGAWNDPTSAVEDARFAALMTRILELSAAAPSAGQAFSRASACCDSSAARPPRSRSASARSRSSPPGSTPAPKSTP